MHYICGHQNHRRHRFACALRLVDEHCAEFSLQHARIQHRHLMVHNGKSQQMAVAARGVTRQRTDAIGVGEGARLAMNFSLELVTSQQAVQCSVDTCDGKVALQLLINGRMSVTIAQNDDQGVGRKLVLRAQTAAIMNDECGVFELQILAHEVAQIG